MLALGAEVDPCLGICCFFDHFRLETIHVDTAQVIVDHSRGTMNKQVQFLNVLSNCRAKVIAKLLLITLIRPILPFVNVNVHISQVFYI